MNMIKGWLRSFADIRALALFRGREFIETQTQRRYAEPVEMEFYSNPSLWSFLPEEEEILTSIRNSGASKVLVIGCGGGREFTKLQGLELHGVDTCLPLLDSCRQNFPTVKTYSSLVHVPKDFFPAIYVSFHVYNHIQGIKNRVDFLDSLLNRLGDNGSLYLFVDELDLKSSVKFKTLNRLLRIVWKGSEIKWEEGDTLRRYNGEHNPRGNFFFYHYFKHSNAVESELEMAGSVRRQGSCWVLTRS